MKKVPNFLHDPTSFIRTFLIVFYQDAKNRLTLFLIEQAILKIVMK